MPLDFIKFFKHHFSESLFVTYCETNLIHGILFKRITYLLIFKGYSKKFSKDMMISTIMEGITDEKIYTLVENVIL